jgi:hypothetical protein
VVVAGLVTGFASVSSGGAPCGSVLNPQDHLLVMLTASESAANRCDSLLSVLAVPTWLLVGTGLVLLAVAGMRATKKPSPSS